jgi:hypothetical protein
MRTQHARPQRCGFLSARCDGNDHHNAVAAKYAFDRAAITSHFRRRYTVTPRPAKPQITIAHVAGSGTAVLRSAKEMIITRQS